jgi:hypothetical protein
VRVYVLMVILRKGLGVKLARPMLPVLDRPAG